MGRSENELKLLDSAIDLMKAEIRYFHARKEFMSNDAQELIICFDNIERLTYEIDYLTALKDGQVVIFTRRGALGFQDLESALAYAEAENVLEGHPAGGNILVIGTESKKAIERLHKEEEDDEHGS